MNTLQIRNVAEDVYAALTLRAERGHRSLAQQAVVDLRRIPLELTAAQRRHAVLAAIREDLEIARHGPISAPEALIPEALILEDRKR